ncbi:MAG: ornithine decarboxylase [Paracoccaceae bacterium]|jgi:ornithine decarboxylase
MNFGKIIWDNPQVYLRHNQPDHPVCFFAPDVLRASFVDFQAGFDGLVTYAVKANSQREVLENLVASGLTAFDVASPAEIKAVRAVCQQATLHYNNPVRSKAEIEFAREVNVSSYSVDSFSELTKLAVIVPAKGIEVSVRLKLPVVGAAYDFGAKFGAGPETCVALLKKVAQLGFTPSMTFHPGTQCKDPSAWATYIETVAKIAGAAGVGLHRLNVGGGFPSHRSGARPALALIFKAINQIMRTAFPTNPPKLVCEPGRAMVAEAFTLAARIKAITDEDHVFLNDGIYGGLAELPTIEANDRVSVVTSDGIPVTGRKTSRVVFGPTCDSLDVLPGTTSLPQNISEGDYVLFPGTGAYSFSLATGFNGYGQIETITVLSLTR